MYYSLRSVEPSLELLVALVCLWCHWYFYCLATNQVLKEQKLWRLKKTDSEAIKAAVKSKVSLKYDINDAFVISVDHMKLLLFFPVVVPTLASLYFHSGLTGHEQLAALGLPMTEQAISWALAWQSILSGFFFLGLKSECQAIGITWKEDRDVIFWHTLSNLCVFWEPFFLFSYLQMVYLRSFGEVPAVFLTSLSFALYHVGTYPVVSSGKDAASCVSLFGMCLLFSSLFAGTGKSLLTFFPFAWGFGRCVQAFKPGPRAAHTNSTHRD